MMEKREAGVGDTVNRERGAAGVVGVARTGSAGSSAVTIAALPGAGGKSSSHSNLLPASQATESLSLFRLPAPTPLTPPPRFR